MVVAEERAVLRVGQGGVVEVCPLRVRRGVRVSIVMRMMRVAQRNVHFGDECMLRQSLAKMNASSRRNN